MSYELIHLLADITGILSLVGGAIFSVYHHLSERIRTCEEGLAEHRGALQASGILER